jgi:hypothetical protein
LFTKSTILMSFIVNVFQKNQKSQHQSSSKVKSQNFTF